MNSCEFWAREQARRKYLSAEADFLQAMLTWSLLVVKARGNGKSHDVRQAGQRTMFAAQTLMQRVSGLSRWGLSGTPSVMVKVRNFMQPGAEVLRNRNRGGWSK